MGFATRLYRRLGSRYLVFVLTLAWLIACALVIGFVLIVTRSYIGMPWGHSLAVVGASVVGASVGVGIIFWIVFWRGAVDLRAWLSGTDDEGTADRAWAQGTGIPPRMARIGFPIIALCVLPANLIFEVLAELPWYTQNALRLAIAMLIALGVALEMAVVAFFLRPVLTEMALRHPSCYEPPWTSRSSLLRRLIVSVLLIVPTSAWLTVATTAREARPARFILYMVIASVVITATYSLVVMVALSDAFVRPVGDLIAATRRVANGDLSVRVPVTATDELGQLTGSFNEMVAGLSERQALHAALGTYVDPVVADRLLLEGQVLEGEDTDVTVMFVDIVAFTAYAERMRPTEVVAELNGFFAHVIPIVQEHGGHPNKLLGDGFMAVFGTPLPLEDHADRAVCAAIEIQRLLAERYRGGLRAGIGLNSGNVVVGTTGGGSKLDFTVIGDVVNVASRVESLTRDTGDGILLTEETRMALRHNHDLAPRGCVSVKGRESPVNLFAVDHAPTGSVQNARGSIPAWPREPSGGSLSSRAPAGGSASGSPSTSPVTDTTSS